MRMDTAVTFSHVIGLKAQFFSCKVEDCLTTPKISHLSSGRSEDIGVTGIEDGQGAAAVQLAACGAQFQIVAREVWKETC